MKTINKPGNGFVAIDNRIKLFFSKEDNIYYDYSNRECPYNIDLSKKKDYKFNIYKNDLIVSDLLQLSVEYASLFPSKDFFFHVEKAFLLISTIYFLSVTDKTNGRNFDSYVYINRQQLMKIISNRYFTRIRDFLIAYGFIECNGSFVRGERSFGYRLGEKYRKLQKAGKLKFYCGKTFINTTKIKQTLCAESEKHIEESLKKVTINKEKAQDIIVETKKTQNISNHAIDCYEFSIDNIYLKNHYLTRSAKCGRVFHLVANLPKFLRTTLKLDNKDIFSIDIKSCQPLLLTTLYPNTCDESEKYKQLVESGQFYKDVADFTNTPLDNKYKEKIKNELWNYIFGRIYVLNSDSQLNKYFETKFPMLKQLIYETKLKINKLDKRPHAKLPIKLQKMESTAIIDNVVLDAKKLNIPVLTIHDSILCNEEHVETMKNSIISTFKKLYNLNPSIAIERY